MGELMILVADEFGEDSPSDLRELEGRIALDRFEHSGAHPIFLIFHWCKESNGKRHSVSIVDHFLKVEEFLCQRYRHAAVQYEVEKIMIILPPGPETGRDWVMKRLIQATVKNTKNEPSQVVYQTPRKDYQYLLENLEGGEQAEWHVLLRNR
ncbi:hypothetical protein [Pseudomonas syringae group sp. J309-1]|uniref:hypothetical protein n=1 Tax=Pseudomonas syringae group sp. J309-1 TaxID=3079588 RepID=UPI002906535B|nr:hypothetical protein [Pseudomonas syringae group sp. J309-1]MDU8361083.1 hypothetical protein [Pseudomonas syringae group sp. J309-1]